MPDTTIIDAFLATRSLTEQLAAPLSAEDQTVQSMPDVSPTKWHRAHVTWFFETFLLERFAADHEPFVAAYRELFNSYYEGVGPQYPRAARGSITRPGAAEVGAYRASVDARMHALLAAHPEHTEIARLTELGIHHEQQHQELLLMDIKHVLSLNPLQPAYRAAPAAMPMPQAPLQWLSFDGGLVETGHDGREFGFDNETPRHAVYVHPFQIADRLVTCGEWQAFIDDGGYRRSELWLSDGWHRVNDEGWRAPLYWLADDEHGWRIHTLAGTRAIDSDEPVCHVSFYEADAFAHWAGKRLPTEFEWEVASGRAGSPRSFDLDVLQPQPAGSGDACLRQAFGECWQWTASAYLPYPGFRPAEGAVGEYNGKFMSGQMVLRGSSAFTPPGHARATYRNFFPPHARWALSGVRLAAGVDA